MHSTYHRFASRKTMAQGAFTLALFISDVSAIKDVCKKLQAQKDKSINLVISAVLFSLCITMQVDDHA